MCFQSDTKKRLVRTCLKKINLSPNFLDTHLCGSYSISSTSYTFFFFFFFFFFLPFFLSFFLTLFLFAPFFPPTFFFFFFFFFFFWNPSYRAYFQPLFLYGLSFTTKFLCDPFHRAHHGNLVRPGKNAPQRTQGHILYKKRGAKHLDLSFFLFLFFPPLFQQLLCWHGKRKKSTRPGLCGKKTTAFYRPGDKNDWMANASSLTESCMELPVPL